MTPFEVGWQIVGPAGKLKFRMSTYNSLSYQDISGWLSPGTLIDDSTYQGSWVWNTPDFPSRKVRLLMEVYGTISCAKPLPGEVFQPRKRPGICLW